MDILFVEDSPALRYSIAKELRLHGHTVHEAESAEQALVALAEHEVDVLITDIGLPGVSGDVFAAEARSLRPTLRVVFATGLESIKAPHYRDAGPTVLRKPYQWNELQAAIDKAR
ncbi:response regulator [Rhizobacter fulvus]|jgi:DNA-binding response OmpR family regulator